MKDRIYLSSPHMGGEEMKYIQEAFDTNWVAPLGKNVEMFEKEMCEYIGRPYAVALSAGTAAIHLGLKYLGVERGDVVFCSSFTFSGTCNPAAYLGAKLVFIDCDRDSYNMSPQALEKAYEIYPDPKAVIIVNLYGNPAEFDELLAITKKHGTPVLEDSAESLGSSYKGKKTGNFGDISIFSFNGNKIITTSGGGMLMCNDKKTHDKVLFWATQSREPFPWYQHEEIGYNYRLSNVSAGIGCGQMEVLADRVERRREIHGLYAKLLGDIPEVRVHGNPSSDVNSNFWLTTILFDERLGFTPEDLRQYLDTNNIESRWLWRPMNMQPVYVDAPFYGDGTAERLFGHGLCLPSGSILIDDEIAAVADAVRTFVKSKY